VPADSLKKDQWKPKTTL